ncbi:MAG: hypothetical protein ACRDJY_06055, partial [Thermoleophilaceae bacterium]
MGTEVGPVPVLERPDLRARIRSALEAGSLLLVADGGFGKTTALHDALGDGPAAAWVSCADAGGDPGRLLGLILEAIREVLPGAVDVLAERMTSAPEAVDPEQAAGALERELARLLVDPLVVCLDDAETLEGSPAALAVAARLIRGRSGLMRLAVASRRVPGIRLARERAAGRLTELGPAELAFSAADCEAYLRLVHGGEPAPDEVDSLMEETEGWPLGVVLAVAGGERGSRGPSRGLLDDYFEEEVLADLEPDRRRGVLAAGMAPDLGIAEAAGVGSESDLGDRPGLLLRAPGDSGERQFHPLFREFLRRRFAEEVAPAERRSVATRVADALEAAGRGPEAVDQRLASEDWASAADAVAREGGALVRRAPDTVGAWIAALPGELVQRPELLLLAGQLVHGQGQLDEAVARCREA